MSRRHTHTLPVSSFFFFNDTATTEIYTLSLHDALPIFRERGCRLSGQEPSGPPSRTATDRVPVRLDRKSTRLNSSHQIISYAVFCLKKKNRNQTCRDIERTHYCYARTSAWTPSPQPQLH